MAEVTAHVGKTLYRRLLERTRMLDPVSVFRVLNCVNSEPVFGKPPGTVLLKGYRWRRVRGWPWLWRRTGRFVVEYELEYRPRGFEAAVHDPEGPPERPWTYSPYTRLDIGKVLKNAKPLDDWTPKD